MKSFGYWLFSMLATVMTVCSACMENDVYDPDKVRDIVPVENPEGADFNAPDGFDWQMLQQIDLTAKVMDAPDFGGHYSLIEIFTTNPAGNASLRPIVAGKAKNGDDFSLHGFTVAKTVSKLYFRLTDPRGRREIYEFDTAPQMTCPLYITSSTTRAITPGQTLTEETVEIANHPEPTIPTDAIEITGSGTINLEAGKNYVIHDDDNLNLSDSNGANIYIDGTCTISGSVIGNLYILKDANVTLTQQIASWKQDAGLYNYGILQVPFLACSSSYTYYNEGILTLTGIGYSPNTDLQSTFTNKGKLIAKNNITIQKSFINAPGGEVTAEAKLSITSSPRIDNFGKITAMSDNKDWSGTYDEGIIGNDNADAVIHNHKEAQIEAYNIKGISIVNHGTIHTKRLDSKTAQCGLYNACALIVDDYFRFTTATLEGGSITGPQVDGQWTGVKEFTTSDQSNVVLKNGSIILVDQLTSGNPMAIKGEGSNEKPSLIKAGLMHYKGKTTYEGLALWFDEEKTDPGVTVSKTNCSVIEDKPKYTIETCAGIIIDGDSGHTPVDPTLPDTGTVSEDNQLTYAFEDNWPIYGDLDMNDVVVSLHKVSVDATDNDANTLTIGGRVQAVGASRANGLGIRLLIDKSDISSIVSNDISFEAGQTQPVFIITNDLFAYMGQTDKHSFINTVKQGQGSITTLPAREFEIKLKFNTLEAAQNAANIQHIDLFIFEPKKGNRREIHVAGFEPTELMDRSFFGSGNDDSLSKGYYLSGDGLAWGVCVPSGTGIWRWPLEWTSVCNAYPEFREWVTGGGQNNLNWYQHPNAEAVY